MSVYKNVIVPIPDEAIVVSSNGRVYLTKEKRYNKEKQYNNNSRIIIGWLNSLEDRTMNPNNNYAVRYPETFNLAAYGKAAPVIKRIGMFMMTLAVADTTGLYQALIDSCGPDYANNVLDYAMYSVQYKTNVAKDFEVLMKEQRLFSDKIHSDSWFSTFFNEKLTQSAIEDFKEKWIQACISRGMEDVWICIDGTNNDCAVTGSDLAEKGHAKSHKNTNIYSYMYAVSASDGCPVYYDVYRGGMVDSKAFISLIEKIKTCGLNVKGVILDRGFCDEKTVNLVVNSGYKFVIMMKENQYGFTHQLELYGREIMNNADYLIGPGCFGCVHQDKIFAKSEEKSYIALLYDAKNGGERVEALTKKVLKEAAKCKKDLEDYGTAEPSKSLAKYIEVNVEDKTVGFTGKLQEELDRKGFSSIACSDDYTAEQISKIYDIRDSSEKQYMVTKTQLGYHTGRSHYDEGIQSRHLVAFVASIIRNELANKCKKLGIEFTTTLKELNFLVVNRMPNNEYAGIHNQNAKQLQLMKQFGLEAKDIDYFALEETTRTNNKVYNQISKMPPRLRKEEKTSKVEEEPVKRKRGRPKGSKNKPKETTQEAQLKRGPGRPKGSKNKPKVNIQA